MPASLSVPIISRISWRSIKPPQAIVTGAVGDGLVTEPESLGRSDGQRRRWLALTGTDIEHDVTADRAADKRDRKSTRLNSSNTCAARMPSCAGKKKMQRHKRRSG